MELETVNQRLRGSRLQGSKPRLKESTAARSQERLVNRPSHQDRAGASAEAGYQEHGRDSSQRSKSQ